MKKKLVSFILSLALLVSIPNLSMAEGVIPVLLNGEKISFEVQPFIKEGTTMVPFRTLFEKLGYVVKWNEDTQSVTGYSNDLTIELQIGSTTAMVNSVPHQLTIAPSIKEGTTFVPLRFIGETSGKNVSWDDENDTVLIRDGLFRYLRNTLYSGSNHLRYLGEHKDGQKSGHGIIFLDNKVIFEGEFKENKISGEGTLYWLGGQERYVGQWSNDAMNGTGSIYNEDGTLLYDSITMVDNIIGGNGTYNFDSGYIYANEHPVIDKAETQEIGINYSAEPPVLDSSIATANAAFTMINAFNEGLYRLDKEGKVQLGLAKDLPTITNNGLTYTITLRDAKWNDGTPVKATDFVSAWKRTLDPATKAQYSFLLTWIKGGEAVTKARTADDVEKAQDALGLKAIDDKTLEINLEHPISYFTSMLAFPIFFPQKADFVKEQGDQYGVDADKVMGAGPFKLVQWNHGKSLLFVKNENYWDSQNVKLNKFVVYIVKNASTALSLYESNLADISELGADYLKLYKSKPDLIKKQELTTSYLMFQEEKFPAFANTKIRKALTLGIDRELLIKTVLNNGSVPSTGLIPDGTLDGNNRSFREQAGDGAQPKFDPEKAKQLLAEGLQELGMATLPSFKLTADDTITGKMVVNFIQEQWKLNLGIDITPEPMAHANRIDKQNRHDFEADVSLWGADYNDPMTFLDMWETGSEFNEVDWSNASYNELLNSARKEFNPETRSKMLVEAEKLLMHEMPIGPLYFRNRVFVKKPNIEGAFLPAFGVEWELKWASVNKE
ncbi:hypothetical protein HZF08_09825 [Paenibacillus sp. CGMCC 1.16610]|uniref:Peptide ABC transporter substrate-binding protein n=1 Tax=Paenibacillus anseongense TaxID=2682845 RepID=A0ABW9UHS4_9BACL|nr:ABC transporter substrate-binding protein [Paenibacillus sp. CGMCC 1.16610]MBA2938604.1 hypothetical protein [Paenibacillus sp. CGMCC 1.16610]MVQ38795.1 hypothetical protein [Paenibacillus anseongense]